MVLVGNVNHWLRVLLQLKSSPLHNAVWRDI